MEKINNLIATSNGIEELDKLIAKIANLLNISIEQVYSNIPYYLSEIARYILIDKMVHIIISSIIVSLILIVLLFLFEIDNAHRVTKSKIIKTVSLCLCVGLLFIIGETVKYIVSPNIYALEYLKSILNL